MHHIVRAAEVARVLDVGLVAAWLAGIRSGTEAGPSAGMERRRQDRASLSGALLSSGPSETEGNGRGSANGNDPVRYTVNVTATESEHLFPSTTFEWRLVKMKTPPAGHDTVRAKRGRWRHLARWPRSEALTVTIRYRGGAESWWLVKARGSHGVFPGHLSIEDVMSVVYSEPSYR